jgi:hypothetical protein
VKYPLAAPRNAIENLGFFASFNERENSHER